jgi:hypothetical protein
VEAVVLHGVHPDDPGRPVLDVLGVAKKKTVSRSSLLSMSSSSLLTSSLSLLEMTRLPLTFSSDDTSMLELPLSMAAAKEVE